MMGAAAATIRPATAADTGAIAAYLAGALGGRGGPARYERYLRCSWAPGDPDAGPGMIIDDADAIRGFVGTIHADRRFGDRIHRICNINSVAVDASHRKLTLQLFGAALARPDVTYTCFTPSAQIAAILDFFKFEHRSAAKALCTPLTGLALGQLAAARRVRVITGADPDALVAALTGDDRTIARDHRRYRCGMVLIVDGDRRCFTVTVRRGRDVRAFADVLYASDPALLAERLPWLHAPLLRAHGTLLTGVDASWLAAPPRGAIAYTGVRPLYLRLARTDPPPVTLARLDTLYSELVPMYGSPA